MAIAALEPVYNQIPSWSNEKEKEPEDKTGMNQFLTMLVAQLQNQDPLNPMDGTDFTAQLAQFTSLEQQFQMNDNLASIQSSLAARENGTVLDYIGKTVKTIDNTIVMKDGQADSGAYTLSDRAEVTIHVYNDQGIEVRKIYKGLQHADEYEVDWDGRDNSGQTVPDGTYRFDIEAKDEQGLFVSFNAFTAGEVTGVTYETGIPYLIIGDRVVSPSSVVEVTNTLQAVDAE
jgi:flagellar basal-body rod modification protein FlgD